MFFFIRFMNMRTLQYVLTDRSAVDIYSFTRAGKAIDCLVSTDDM